MFFSEITHRVCVACPGPLTYFFFLPFCWLPGRTFYPMIFNGWLNALKNSKQQDFVTTEPIQNEEDQREPRTESERLKNFEASQKKVEEFKLTLFQTFPEEYREAHEEYMKQQQTEENSKKV